MFGTTQALSGLDSDIEYCRESLLVLVGKIWNKPQLVKVLRTADQLWCEVEQDQLSESLGLQDPSPHRLSSWSLHSPRKEWNHCKLTASTANWQQKCYEHTEEAFLLNTHFNPHSGFTTAWLGHPAWVWRAGWTRSGIMKYWIAFFKY